MSFILGKKVLETLYESENSLVLRALDDIDPRHVILKILKKNCPDPREISRYKNEYEIIRILNSPGVIRAHSLERYHDSFVLILEDIQAVSLAEFCGNNALELEIFLDIAVQIAKSLGYIHTEHIIHKNLNPSNIIYNPLTKQIRIIDFGIASVLSEESRPATKIRDIGSNLAYMSPEQTGKMDRGIDFRSDFYSLGIAFYELLCGHRPFPGSDPLEMVYAHLAKLPPPLTRFNPDIPGPVCDIVMKLLEKNPDNRYQESISILNDLTRCQSLLKTRGQKFDFPVSPSRRLNGLKISGQLFGRDRELARLSHLFGMVKAGQKKIALVSGPAGVGKTALVMELGQKIVMNQGYFIAGKFDQARKDVPYGAMVDVFSQLIQKVLMEKESVFKHYQQNLQTSLGGRGQIMVDLFPELEYIIGPQDPVVDLPLVEAKNRFVYVFENFIRGFAGMEQPIVLFLDDLQWADTASLEILEMILLADDIKYGFFIGAFRDGEIEASHPWQAALKRFQHMGFDINTICPAPLNTNDVNQYVSASLHCPREKCLGLSDLVMEKTLGNPFYIREFLTAINAKKLLEFDPSAFAWKWELNSIREEMAVNESIVGLVMDRMHMLGHEAMDLLKIAACLGNRFHAYTLSLISGKSMDEVFDLLDAVAVQGIVIHILHGPKAGGRQGGDVAGGGQEFKFLHDRFQNAAYSMIKPEEKPGLHWKIGRLMLKSVPGLEKREDILDIVNHLNLGKTTARRESQKHLLAQVNLLATQKVKALSAFEASFTFLETGISVFCPKGETLESGLSAWERDYDLCLNLHEEAVETAFLISRYDRMEALAKIVDEKAGNILDRVRITEVRIRSLYAQNRLVEAVDTAISFAGHLGEKLPRHPTRAHLFYEMLKMQFFLKGKNIQAFAGLPVMTRPEPLAIQKILSSMVLPAYYARPNLVPLIVFRGMHLSLTHGNTEESLFGYAGYGFILCSINGDMDLGYQFGELARNLLDRLDAGRIRARTMATIYLLIQHWRMPLKEVLDPLLEAHKSGMEFGDHQYAAICAKGYCSRAIYAGVDLKKIEQDAGSYTKLIKKLNQDVALNYICIVRQMVSNLQGKSKLPWLLKGDFFDSEQMVPRLYASKDQMGVFTSHLMNLILCCLFEKFDLAMDFSPGVRQNLKAARGTPETVIFNFFESLSILGFLGLPAQKNKIQKNKTWKDKIGTNKKKCLNQVRTNQQQLNKWSQSAPMNFEHLFCLVEAERFNFNQDPENAKKFYDLAIRYSNKNGYVNFEAVARELFGRFHLKCRDLDAGKDEILLAHQAYLQWDALGKCRDLEKKYAVFFQDPGFSNQGSAHPGISDRGKEPMGIDMRAVLKASQAISKTMEFDKLMAELVRVVIAYSGAQKACLMLYSDKILKIQVMAETDPDSVRILNSIVLDENTTDLPISILYYSVRSGQSVILGNASHQNKFSLDPYLAGKNPLSILCTPLVSKKSVKGVLYLENNLIKGAFSREHLEILGIFTSQILISIENSQLYETLVKQIEEKDRAVKEIQTKQELLQNIAGELAAAEERERKIIAEDLHDSVSQSLAFSISSLRTLDLKDMDHTRDRLSDVLTYLKQAANNIRSLTFQLSPPLLKDFGLEDTLDWLCEDIFTRYSLKIEVEKNVPTPVYLDETVKLTLYRVIRELVMNIVKHAGVETAFLGVSCNRDRFFIVLEDRGAGFDGQVSPEESDSFGLFSVYRRMEAIRGNIRIRSEKGKGTVASIDVPLVSPS